MGKKESLNPFNYRDNNSSAGTSTNSSASANPFDYRGVPKATDYTLNSDEARNVALKELEAKAEANRKIYDTAKEYAGLNNEEKEYLVNKEKQGLLQGEDLARAAWIMAGNDKLQQSVVSKDANGKLVYSNLADMQKKADNEGFWSSALSEIELSKHNGGNYYMKDRGDGVIVPVPLAYNEKPEAKDTKNAQVFSSLDDDAYGDSRFVDIAKKAWNIVPSVSQSFVSIPETVQGLITGKTGKGYEVVNDVLEAAKFKTANEFNKSIIDSGKIDEFSDYLSTDAYDLSPDKIVNSLVNVGQSLAQFALTRKLVPINGKAGTFAAGTLMNIGEPLKAAEEAGVEGRSKYIVAAVYSLAASAIETSLGIEGKLFSGEANAAKREVIKKIIKDNVEEVGGKLTKESIENLYKETLKEAPSFYTKYLKNIGGEVTEEVAQNMIQNATQEIHDIVTKDDPEAAKYNTKFWSPKALAEYANSAFGGLLGGGVGSVAMSNKQSETAYTAVANGKQDELKADLASSLKRGKITQDEYDRAVFKINSYKEYYDATIDRPINDEDKRKIFDLTYEKQNIKSSIESLEKKNPNGINDGLINTKKQQLADLNNQVNEIWTKADVTASNVTNAKKQVPAWKVSVDNFAKEVGNPDKTVSQDFTNREQIETAIGVTSELNQLAKPFKVEFKTPSLPEEAGGIKVENGFLSEPYMTEKTETSEPTLKTRELPVYAMEDKDGGTWLFAAGDKTDNNIPDTSYLIKVGEDGKYEGHQEFHYEAPKKNTLTFDDIPEAFNRLGLKPIGTSESVKEFKSEDEQLFHDVYTDVLSGNDKGKLTTFPGGTLGVIVNGKPIKFASSYHTNAFLNRENMPDGDVEVGIRAEENVKGKHGKGLMVYNIETGADIGYLRATDKSSGVKSSGVESDLSSTAKEKLASIEADQNNYEIHETAMGPMYVNKKSGEAYRRVSSFVGGKFTGKEKLKGKAFGIGKVIEGIVTDFFQGEIKDYSEYNKNMSKQDYDDIISQLNEVKNFAKKRGFSIITKPMVIADDVNKIAGVPNLLMVDKRGNFYVYDISTIRNPLGNPIREQMQKVFKGAPMTTEERVSAQTNIYADILEGKYGVNVAGVGVIPFNVNYNTTGDGLKIDSVKKSKRIDYDRKKILNNVKPIEVVAYKEPVKESRYDKGKRASEIAVEGEFNFKNNEEATRFVAENSNNPAEIAEAYLTLDAVKENTKDYKTQMLDEANVTLTEENFNKVVDPNKMSPAIKKKFIRKSATPLDEQLQSISEDAGVEITERDFENYIDEFEKPKTPSVSLKRLLAERYHQITDGKKLTRAVARNIVEDVKKATAKQEASDIAKAMMPKNIIPEGKDIVRGSENDEMAFQKVKAVKDVVGKAVDLFYKIKNAEGGSKKRNLTKERKSLLENNPSVKFVDDNIAEIFSQLEKKNIITKKGNCP